MSEKNIKSRIIHKHDLESNWILATNFTPKQGELIIYDIDDNHSYERFKIGDGKTNVNLLPFTEDILKTYTDDAVAQKSQVQVIKTKEEEETTTTEHLPTLQIYRLSQAEYDEKVAAGDIDENALYLTPSNNVDLSKYAMREDVTQVQIITWGADD